MLQIAKSTTLCLQIMANTLLAVGAAPAMVCSNFDMREDLQRAHPHPRVNTSAADQKTLGMSKSSRGYHTLLFQATASPRCALHLLQIMEHTGLGPHSRSQTE